MCQPQGDLLEFILNRQQAGEDIDDEDYPVELETFEAQWIVDRFWELNNRRAGFGVPINFAEIEAYQRLTGRRLSNWQVKQICRLDNLYLEACNELRTELSKRNG